MEGASATPDISNLSQGQLYRLAIMTMMNRSDCCSIKDELRTMLQCDTHELPEDLIESAMADWNKLFETVMANQNKPNYKPIGKPARKKRRNE